MSRFAATVGSFWCAALLVVGCAGGGGAADDELQALRTRLLAGEREALELVIGRLGHPDPARAAAAEEVLAGVAGEYGAYLRAATRRNDATTPGLLRVLGRTGSPRNVAHLKRLAKEPKYTRAAELALEVAEQKAFEDVGFDLRRLRDYERAFPEGLYIAEVRDRIRMLTDLNEFIAMAHPDGDGERLRAAVANISDMSPVWQEERRTLAGQYLKNARAALADRRLSDALRFKDWAVRLAPELRVGLPRFDLELARAAAQLGALEMALDALERAVINDPALEGRARPLREKIFLARGRDEAVYEVRVIRLVINDRGSRSRRESGEAAEVRVVLRVGLTEVSTDIAHSGGVAEWPDSPRLRVGVNEEIAIAVVDDGRGRDISRFGPSQLPLTGLMGQAELEFDRVRELVLQYRRVR